MRDTAAADLHLPTGAEAAVALAELLRESDVVWAAATEAEAGRIAAALAVAAPAARVVLMPETDALPGAGIAASAANIGQRRAALMALAAGEGRRTALVTTVGALAHVWPAPGAALDPGLVLRPGDAADLAGLTQRLVALGYVEDDRVDEPGEVALHGQVVDLFPAQDAAPVRIEAADGRITAISRYDAVDQRTIGDLDAVRALSAQEPAAAGGSLLPAAAAAGADVLLTSDLKHHPASDALEVAGPALCDVAHFASEWPWLPVAAAALRDDLAEAVEVAVSRRRTDPWSLSVGSSS